MDNIFQPHSESIKQISKALSQLQGAMKPILRTGKVEYYSDKTKKMETKYTFTELVNIISTITPLNLTHGLSFTQLVSEHPDGRTILMTMLCHESGEWFKSWMAVKGQVVLNSFGKASTSEAQALKSVITQARRTLLSAILGIAEEEDDDGEKDRQHEEEVKNKHGVTVVPVNDKKTQDLEAAKKLASELIKQYGPALRQLCEEVEIEVEDFCKFHNISYPVQQKDANKLKDAVTNFDALRIKFQYRTDQKPISHQT